MKEMILFVLLVLTLIAMYWCVKHNKNSKDSDKEKECIYNENRGCYGTCCNFCLSKSECNWVCGGEHEHCGGWK